MIQADYFLQSGDAQKALVIGAETLSRVSDPHDRDSMLYADGAGAAVLEVTRREEPVGILAHATRSDTLEHARLLWMGASYDPEFEDNRLFLKMRGRNLYEYALNTVPGVVRLSLEKAGADPLRRQKCSCCTRPTTRWTRRSSSACSDSTAAQIPDGIMPMTISWLGNSSVATLPTLLDLIVRGRAQGQRLQSGDIVVFASVGAGMNINSLVYRWP